MNTQGRGFTLIELIITMAVVAVLISIANPAFNNLIENNRVSTYRHRLFMALQVVRSEAIKLNQTVRMCQSADGQSCNANDWHSGWLIWADLQSDGSHAAEDGSKIIQYIALNDTTVEITNSRSMTWIGYRSDGSVTGSSGFANSTWKVCSTKARELQGRGVVINRIGRPRQKSGLDCTAE